jgi:PBSX family phage portal protein
MGNEKNDQVLDIVATVIEVEKATDSGIPQSNKLPEDPFRGMYDDGIIEPPFELSKLVQIPESSNILPQCIDAMETNIDGFGYILEPEEGVEKDKDGKWPPAIQKEYNKIKNFFEYCHPEESFTEIRRKTRKDIETVGFGFWELLENGKGELVGIEHLEAYTMRLTKLDKEPIEIKMNVKTEDNQFEQVPFMKRFRRYVQIREGQRVYFKEFGDPRIFGAKTGKELTEADITAGQPQATPVLFFRKYSPRTPYGIPRWIGTLISVLGSRQAEEVNFEYFENKSIPPLAILCSGRLAADTKTTIESYVQNNLKGKSNFHKILVIETTSEPNPMAPAGQRTGVEIKPLTDAQQKDALFINYDEKNQEKVASSFRLPGQYVGKTKDFNRATAEVATEVAEQQIFTPERDEFDFIINRRILPVIGAKNWKFKSLSATVDNSKDLTEMLKTFSSVAGLTVREVRQLIAEILNKPLKEIEGNPEWLDQPLEVFMKGKGQPVDGTTDPNAKDSNQQPGVKKPIAITKEAAQFLETLIEVKRMITDVESADIN